MCRLFPCIPIFRGFFPIKKCKKMCLCDKIKKKTMLLMRNVFINVNKGISELGVLGSCKTYY